MASDSNKVTEQRFLNRAVIITGGSSGIGAACVKLFFEHGAHVVFCSNAEDEGKTLEHRLRETSQANHVDFVFADVTKEDEVIKVVDFCVKKHERIDCLVNNVGWHPLPNTIDGFSSDDFRKLLDLNVVSYFLFDKYALPYLRKCPHPDGASIVNISSITNHLGQNRAVTYVASKGAVAAMTRALAVDEARHKVRVNSVSPSNVDTPLMWDNVTKSSTDVAKTIKFIEDLSVFNRMASSMEVAKSVLFLATDATYCTGIDLLVAGGCELAKG